jgi:putative sterol carrier protein
MSAKEFFDGLESRVDESKTAGMNNSYIFDIEGAGTTSEETFEKITSGEQNATSAYMTGKLKVKGDMGAAMKLQKLF